MKRICILICLCLLAGMLCACDLSGEPQASVSVVDTEPSEGTELSESTEPTETVTETEETTVSIDEQIALMVEARQTWIPEEEWYYQPYSYVVTDLNQNGLLELMVSSCQGTGMFTVTDVYEISEDGTHLDRFYNSMGEGASQADLIVGQAPVYYNEETGIYFYVFTDSMRSGWEWNGQEYHAVYMGEDMLMELLIAGASYEWDEQENCTEMYYNAYGEEIDKAGFEAAVEEYFAGCVEMQALFAWQNYDYDEVTAMDAEDWARALAASYSGFSVS